MNEQQEGQLFGRTVLVATLRCTMCPNRNKARKSDVKANFDLPRNRKWCKNLRTQIVNCLRMGDNHEAHFAWHDWHFGIAHRRTIGRR
jgi:hypothetical protein